MPNSGRWEIFANKMTDISSLEKAVGYSFCDKELLLTALRNPSYLNGRAGDSTAEDNQRLEFLGDAVLGLLSAEHLFRQHVEEDEGLLTMRRSLMVSGAALSEIAERINLKDYLELGKGMKMYGDKYLADAVEAIFGAAWLDGGLAAARAIFRQLGFYSRKIADPKSRNPKGELQEYFQLQSWGSPVYLKLSVSGPAHAPHFKTSVTTPNGLCAEGEGGSRRAAETDAAEKLLAALKSGG